MRGLARRLSEGEFETSIDFQSSIKSAWLVWAAGAQQRVGFGWNVGRELNPLVNNTLVHTPDTECHRIERDLALLSPLGIPPRHRQPVLACNDRDEKIIDRRLEQRLSGGPLVILHPGTSDFASFKRWQPERYAEVAGGLADRHGADVLVSYGPGEEEIARAVWEAEGTAAKPAPETENLQQLIHLLSRADLFIGSDTGPLHVASALEVPCVALFGPKDPTQTGPYCSRSAVVTGEAHCRPCERRTCPAPRCMTTIKAEEVLSAASRILRGGGVRRAGRDVLRLGAYFEFSLGRWRGEVECSCSSPDFFSRLTELTGGGAAGDERGAAMTLPNGSTVRARPERSRGLWTNRRARDGWRQSVYALRRGLSVPFHACCTWDDGRLFRRTIVAREEKQQPGDLEEWLDDGREEAERKERKLASAVAQWHRKGLYHGNLGLETVSTTGQDGIRFDGLGYGFRMDGLPPSVRLLLRSKDMASLLQDMTGDAGGRRARRILRCYCHNMNDAASTQRIIRYIVALAAKWGQNTTRASFFEEEQ